MSLAKRLKLLRIELKISQEKLAEILEISKDRISNMESGKVKNIKGQELQILEEKYNVDPIWLSVGKGNIFKSQKTFIGVHGINNGNIHFGDKHFPQEILDIANYLYNNVPPAKYAQVFDIIKNLSNQKTEE